MIFKSFLSELLGIKITNILSPVEVISSGRNVIGLLTQNVQKNTNNSNYSPDHLTLILLNKYH